MEQLPVEIFDLILKHLTLTDWKCLRLTSRSIYTALSTISSYSNCYPIYIVPNAPEGITLLERTTSMTGIDHLLLSKYDPKQLRKLLENSEAFRSFLQYLTGLSFSSSTRLIDSQLFYDILNNCKLLEKLDLSNYNFFFLSHKFPQNSQIFHSVKRLNLSNNIHLSDYAFNRLVEIFPNLNALHLFGIPLRSSLQKTENRTCLTFENLCSYFQENYQRFQELTISFDRALECDAQVKRLFLEIPPQFNYCHIDGSLSISTLLHLLILFNNQLKTLIVGCLILDHTGCQPLFAGVNELASNLRHLSVISNPSKYIFTPQPQKPQLPVMNPSPSVSLSALKMLNILDIQTLYSLSEIELIGLLTIEGSLSNLTKLALPKNCTDEVIRLLCTRSACARSIKHLNLNNCPSISNRAVLFINKHLTRLNELWINYNINITDFAFIGLSICGIGKAIEWIDHTMIYRKFIEDLPIWSFTVSHQISCQCDLPDYYSSSCVKLRLKDFNFDYDESSSRILSLLIENPYFNDYFYSINRLKSLKILKLRQCIQLTNRLFSFAFRDLPSLKLLDLSGCEKLTDQNLDLIGQNCPSIETIDLTDCNRITDTGRKILRQYAQRLSDLEF